MTPVNALVTDSLLPASGLAGKLLLSTDGGGSTRGFRVRCIERQGNRTLVEVDREPAMTIDKGVRQTAVFPQLGNSGGLGFRILRILHW